MFISRGTNQKINRLQERSLRILYQDDISSYAELLEKDKSVTNHVKNLQLLATEMYKVHNNISPNFICEMFPKCNVSYHLRKKNDFTRPKPNTVWWGSETLGNIGPQIWNMLSSDIKDSYCLKAFKLKIKLRKPEIF